MCSGGASGSARERKCGARNERQYIARLPECECNGAWHLTDLRHREWWHARVVASQMAASNTRGGISSCGGISSGGNRERWHHDRQGHTDDDAMTMARPNQCDRVALIEVGLCAQQAVEQTQVSAL